MKKILVFNVEADAQNALDIINSRYGCNYEDVKGYKMSSWDNVKKIDGEDKWYFSKPEEHLGKTVDELLDGLTGFEEVDFFGFV